MNGRRRKALRKMVAQQIGRKPNGKVIVSEDFETGEIGYVPSQWRRIKKAYKERRRSSNV